MQRFYQAVELDEAEMERKRSASVEPNSKMKSKVSESSLDTNEFASIRDANYQLVFRIQDLLLLLFSTFHCNVEL